MFQAGCTKGTVSQKERNTHERNSFKERIPGQSTTKIRKYFKGTVLEITHIKSSIFYQCSH